MFCGAIAPGHYLARSCSSEQVSLPGAKCNSANPFLPPGRFDNVPHLARCDCGSLSPRRGSVKFEFGCESHRNMAAEIKKEIQLEIAHVLFIDIVGYSKLSINDQHAAVEELNGIVRASEQFQQAEAANRLVKIPNWRRDGAGVLHKPGSAGSVRGGNQPRAQGTSAPALRMGIHSGPVSGVVDVNERANLAGSGINSRQTGDGLRRRRRTFPPFQA